MQESPEPPITWPLQHVPIPRRASYISIGIALVICVGMIAYFQILVRQNPEKWYPPSLWLQRVTGGLINGTLVAGVTIQVVLIVGFLIKVCLFRPREIGLDTKRLPMALALTALVWAATQVILMAVFALAGKEIAVNPEWAAAGWPRASGQWLGQLFGNTPLEEVFFRGFLLPQCLLIIMGWMPNLRPWVQVFGSVVLSQAVFALAHVFLNWNQSQGQWLLPIQFVMGILFAGLYVQTGNLFLAMGLHTLVNNPGPLLKEHFPGPGLGGAIIGFGILVSVIIHPWMVRCLSWPMNRRPKR